MTVVINENTKHFTISFENGLPHGISLPMLKLITITDIDINKNVAKKNPNKGITYKYAANIRVISTGIFVKIGFAISSLLFLYDVMIFNTARKANAINHILKYASGLANGIVTAN